MDRTMARRSVQISPGAGRRGVIRGADSCGFIMRGRTRMTTMISPIKSNSWNPENMRTFCQRMFNSVHPEIGAAREVMCSTKQTLRQSVSDRPKGNRIWVTCSGRQRSSQKWKNCQRPKSNCQLKDNSD